MATVTSNTGIGALVKAGFQIETGAYGVVATIGANDLLPLLSENIMQTQLWKSVAHFNGYGVDKTAYTEGRDVIGTIELELHYEALMQILACSMGQSHQDQSPVDLGLGTAYRHYFDLDYSLLDRDMNTYDAVNPSGSYIRRGTLAIDKQNSVWQHISVMLNGFSFEASRDSQMFSFNVVAQDTELGESPNTASSSWTILGGGKPLFSDLVVYLRRRDIFTIPGSSTLQITDTGGTVSVTITAGTYSGAELAAQLSRDLTDDGTLTGTYVCTYYPGTRKFHLKCDEDCVIETGGNYEQYFGWSLGSASAREHFSQFEARPDEWDTLGATDQVNATKLSLTVGAGLQVARDANSERLIHQPYSTERAVEGSIIIARHKNDDVINDAIHGAAYSMYWEWVGDSVGSDNYRVGMYFPDIRLKAVGVPTPGPQKLTQQIDFVAVKPRYLNVEEFLEEQYRIRDFKDPGATSDTDCVGVYNDQIIAGGDIGGGGIRFWHLVGNTWTEIGTQSGTSNALCIQQYNGKVYLSGDNNKIYEWDGTTFAESGTNVGNFQDLAVFNDLLIGIRDDGDIYSFDGTTWTVRSNVAGGQGHRVCVYNGNAYALQETNLRARVLDSSDGTSWSVSFNFTGLITEGSLCVHGGYLYCTLDNNIRRYDGSSWTTLTAPSITPKHMISWGGNLILLESGSGAGLYYYDIESENTVAITSVLSEDFNQKPVCIDGRLFMPVADGEMKYIEPAQPILITVNNDESTNPL